MTTVTNPNQTNFGIGGTSDRFAWHFKGQEYQVVYETLGQGKPVLMLPAFSTVSSRTEMKGIAGILAAQYQVTVPDWLGFGESQCPNKGRLFTIRKN